jgi:hypothetical protein
MLHLFNKTYLTLDFNINLNDHRIVISEKNGYPLMAELLDIVAGSLIAKSTSLDELFISEDENFQNFSNITELFSFCNNFNNEKDTRVVIQADPKAFMEISAHIFKRIFANPSVDATYSIIEAAFCKKAVIGLSTNSVGQKHWLDNIPSKTEYETIYNSVVVENTVEESTLLSSIENSLSFDYLIASYFVDGSKKTQLKSLIHKHCTRQATSYVKDTWEVIRTNITNPRFKTLLGYSNTYNIGNLPEIFEDENFEIYKKLLPSSFPGDIEKPIQGEADFLSLTQQEIDTLLSHVAKCTLWTDEIANSEFVIRMAFKSVGDVTDQELDQFLSSEQDSSIRIIKDRDRDNWNVYMLELVYNSANPAELLPYKLK